MDELRLNKVFAGFLFAALLLMAGVKIADVMVPHQELAENAYVCLLYTSPSPRD